MMWLSESDESCWLCLLPCVLVPFALQAPLPDPTPCPTRHHRPIIHHHLHCCNLHRNKQGGRSESDRTYVSAASGLNRCAITAMRHMSHSHGIHCTLRLPTLLPIRRASLPCNTADMPTLERDSFEANDRCAHTQRTKQTTNTNKQKRLCTTNRYGTLYAHCPLILQRMLHSMGIQWWVVPAWY